MALGPLPAAIWRVLLLVVERTRVDVGGHVYEAALASDDAARAREVFGHLPALAKSDSAGLVQILAETKQIQGPVQACEWSEADRGFHLTAHGSAELLKAYSNGRDFDSIIVRWPPPIGVPGKEHEIIGWGGDLLDSGVTLADISREANDPRPGEAYLHEWLHGVISYMRKRGAVCELPLVGCKSLVDAGETLHFERSEATGWQDFLQRLMTGRLNLGWHSCGIDDRLWRGCQPPTCRHHGGPHGLPF